MPFFVVNDGPNPLKRPLQVHRRRNVEPKRADSEVLISAHALDAAIENILDERASSSEST